MRSLASASDQRLFRDVVGVDDEVDAVLVDQILEALLHETDDDGDVEDVHLVQLLYDPLHHGLTMHLEKPLRAQHVDGRHPHTQAGREDNGVVR